MFNSNKFKSNIIAFIFSFIHSVTDPSIYTNTDYIISFIAIIIFIYAFSFLIYFPISLFKSDIDFNKFVFYISIISIPILMYENGAFLNLWNWFFFKF
jgi:hypothetical protein